MLTIRPAQENDLSYLSEYWYDNIALMQQTNPRIRLLPDARKQWESDAQKLLDADNTIFLVAQKNGELLGYILARIIPNQAGLSPETIGVIDALMLDLHTPHQQQGTGRALFDAAKDYLIDRHITQLEVRITAQATVAQAFWLGVGAKKVEHTYWMKL